MKKKFQTQVMVANSALRPRTVLGTVRRRLSATALLAAAVMGLFGGALLLVPMASPASAAMSVLCNAYNYSCDPTHGYYGQSIWNYPGGHNCTNYAAYREALNGVPNPGAFGNASSWAAAARDRGFLVNGKPAVGAVAQWNAWAPPAAGYGHVAYVQEVGPDYIVVAEDNYPENNLDVTKITMGYGWPSNFIHFKDIAAPAPWSVGSATYLGDHLSPGQALVPNSYIMSPDLRTVLILQGDGNLVLYTGGGHALWASNTPGQAVSEALFQDDGNFVLYGPTRAIWNSQTQGRGASLLTLQNDGNLVIYNTSVYPVQPVWATNTAIGAGPVDVSNGYLYKDNPLLPNQFIRSGDGRYALVLQGDGNLVLYGPGWHALWNSGTPGRAATEALLQDDGNFVLYGPSGATWNSQTQGRSVSYMGVQSDGNVVMRGPGGVAVWATGTNGRV